MDVNQLIIRLIGDTSGYTNSLNKAKRDARDFANVVNATTLNKGKFIPDLTNEVNKFAANLKKIEAVASGIRVGPGNGMTGALKSRFNRLFGDAATGIQESMAKLASGAQVGKRSYNDVKNMISNMEELFYGNSTQSQQFRKANPRFSAVINGLKSDLAAFSAMEKGVAQLRLNRAPALSADILKVDDKLNTLRVAIAGVGSGGANQISRGLQSRLVRNFSMAQMQMKDFSDAVLSGDINKAMSAYKRAERILNNFQNFAQGNSSAAQTFRTQLPNFGLLLGGGTTGLVGAVTGLGTQVTTAFQHMRQEYQTAFTKGISDLGATMAKAQSAFNSIPNNTGGVSEAFKNKMMRTFDAAQKGLKEANDLINKGDFRGAGKAKTQAESAFKKFEELYYGQSKDSQKFRQQNAPIFAPLITQLKADTAKFTAEIDKILNDAKNATRRFGEFRAYFNQQMHNFKQSIKDSARGGLFAGLNFATPGFRGVIDGTLRGAASGFMAGSKGGLSSIVLAPLGGAIGGLTALATGLARTGLRGVIEGIFGAFSYGVGVVRQLGTGMIRLGMEMERVRTSFGVLTGSPSTGNALFGDLQKTAIASPFKLSQLTGPAETLLGFGVNVQDVAQIVSRLGDLSGGSAEKLSRLTLAFGQVASAGRFMGTELRQFSEAGVGLKDFAQTARMGESQFRAMMSEGAIGADVVYKTLIRLTSEGGRFANMNKTIARTVTGSWNTLGESVEITLGRMGEAFFKSSGLAKGLQSASSYIQNATVTFESFASRLGTFAAPLIKQFDNIAAATVQIGLLLGEGIIKQIARLFNVNENGASSFVDTLIEIEKRISILILKIVEFGGKAAGAFGGVRDFFVGPNAGPIGRNVAGAVGWGLSWFDPLFANEADEGLKRDRIANDVLVAGQFKNVQKAMTRREVLSKLYGMQEDGWQARGMFGFGGQRKLTDPEGYKAFQDRKNADLKNAEDGIDLEQRKLKIAEQIRKTLEGQQAIIDKIRNINPLDVAKLDRRAQEMSQGDFSGLSFLGGGIGKFGTLTATVGKFWDTVVEIHKGAISIPDPITAEMDKFIQTFATKVGNGVTDYDKLVNKADRFNKFIDRQILDVQTNSWYTADDKKKYVQGLNDQRKAGFFSLIEDRLQKTAEGLNKLAGNALAGSQEAGDIFARTYQDFNVGKAGANTQEQIRMILEQMKLESSEYYKKRDEVEKAFTEFLKQKPKIVAAGKIGG